MTEASPIIANARPRLAGYFRATCERTPAGASYLSQREYRVPINISKPYWDGQSLLLNLMSPTAGMLEGDEVELQVTIKPKASLTLSNPTALRIHKMSGPGEARWEQSFTLEENAFLELNPEWLIPQGASRFTQATSLELAAGAELLFIEALAPGRIAHGEAFAFERFRNRLELRYDGQLAALEKHDIRPQRASHRAWASHGPSPFYASLLCVSEKLRPESELWTGLQDLENEKLRIGSSQLHAGPCWNIKILSDDPTLVRKAIQEARERFYQAIGRHPSKLRRQ